MNYMSVWEMCLMWYFRAQRLQTQRQGGLQFTMDVQIP